LDDASWKDVIGLGVAGNFAGHLEQAGEASDFVGVEVEDPNAPKGVFPFYVPGAGEHFLHTYPISSERIRLGSPGEKHQIEPEMALLCDLEYADGRVVTIRPRRAMAHNDCSIRREGARKISEKKNWGPESKGTATDAIEIDRFSRGGVLDRYRIASFLLREGVLHDYGVDSSAASYSYMYEKLVAWLVSKLNDQADSGPLENISAWLEVAGRPARALISIGATRYTDFGETTFLEPGDEIVVALYDGSRLELESLRAIARGEEAPPNEGLSLLRQRVA
jgi:hypothetical protein